MYMISQGAPWTSEKIKKKKIKQCSENWSKMQSEKSKTYNDIIKKADQDAKRY